jgi:16S rRNA (cytosine1402-N4)-methyltransferase
MSKGGWSLLRNALRHENADHVPVLADEVHELLAVQPGETVIDCTFGAGGHAELLAADLQGRGRFIAIDKDASVRPYFERFQRGTSISARFLRGDFAVILGQLADNGVEADAIHLDLGISSMQIDRPERGFSYAADAPLDMRMDASAPRSAREIINEADERELADIFRSSDAVRSSPSSAPPTSWRSFARPSQRRGASATAIRRSASSRRCGSSSTRSSSRSSRLCQQPSGFCAPADGSPSSASTRSRTGS